MTNEDEEDLSLSLDDKTKEQDKKGFGEVRDSRERLTYLQNLILNLNYIGLGQMEIARRLGRCRAFIFQQLRRCEKKGYTYYRHHKFHKPIREFIIRDINLPPKENVLIRTDKNEEEG